MFSRSSSTVSRPSPDHRRRVTDQISLLTYSLTVCVEVLLQEVQVFGGWVETHDMQTALEVGFLDVVDGAIVYVSVENSAQLCSNQTNVQTGTELLIDGRRQRIDATLLDIHLSWRLEGA